MKHDENRRALLAIYDRLDDECRKQLVRIAWTFVQYRMGGVWGTRMLEAEGRARNITT